MMPEGISWNYTTWLNIVAIAVSALLFWRFLRTGGPAMLRIMDKSPDAHVSHAHGHEHE